MSQIPAAIKIGSKPPPSVSTGTSPHSPATVVSKPRNSSGSIRKSSKKDKDQLLEPHIQEQDVDLSIVLPTVSHAHRDLSINNHYII